MLDGEERTLTAGEQLTVVPGTWHRWWNAGQDAVQRLLFPPLAALARLRGLERTVDRYLELEAHPAGESGRGRLPEQVMRRIDGGA